MNIYRKNPVSTRCYTHKKGESIRFLILLIACILIPLTITACAPVIGKTQPAQTEWLILGPEGSIGQTFVANYDGLSGIQVALAPHTQGTGKINLHLRADAQSTTDIATSSLSISKVNSTGNYSFFFDPQNISRRKYYYVIFDIRGEGAVQVGAASGDTYLDGARYMNSIPQDGQLSFRLMYSLRRLGLGLVREFVIWGGVLLVGVFLFLLPGWGLLNLLWPEWNVLTWMEKLGLSAGISISIYPILLLWTGLVGMRLGPLYAWLPPITGLGIFIWFNRALLLRRKTAKSSVPQTTVPVLRSIHRLSLSTIVMLLVIALLIFSRFWAIRTMDAPIWGDSYQHTVIAQRIVEHNGLFRSWQPYSELVTFTYHFGFHSAAAVFNWVTGLSMPRTILWVGQILNILAILSLYPLATKVCRNRWSGVTAVIIAGLVAPVPMAYTNWGRYTQLAGQIVLLAGIYLLWSVTVQSTQTAQISGIESASPSSATNRNRRAILLTAIVMGGLALTHFRVLVFAILFLAAIFISSGLFRINLQQWKTLALKTLWIGLGGGIIFLPWFINAFGGKIIRNFTNQLTTPASAVSIDMQSYNAVGGLLQYLPVGVWLLLPLAAALGLWKQHKGIALVSLWGFLLLIAANPAWLRLPGTGALSNFAIFIAVYIPAGILIGAAVGLLADEFSSREWRADLSLKLTDGWKANLLRLGVVGVRKNSRLPKWIDAMIALVLIGISILGVFQRVKDLHPERYALLTRPDMRAASWIKDNLHPEANLLVNSFFAYGGSLIVGSDGGWWLPVLTKRHTTLPPLNYGTERGPQPDYRQWVNELTKAISEKGLSHPDVLNMLYERKITQVYVGQRQGRVNYFGPAVFDPRQLVNDPHYRTVYHQDRVWIFEVVQTP
jgi:uncharacterized membrane protein